MQYIVTHRTYYDYGDVVPECFNLVRLSPRPFSHQRTLKHELLISPEPSERMVRKDFFGNNVEHFAISEPHTSLTVVARNSVDLSMPVTPVDNASPAWESVASDPLNHDLLAAHFRFASTHIRLREAFAEYARKSFTAKRPIEDAAKDLTNRIFNDFKFDGAATTVSTPVEEVFEKRAGVCQDFAHLQIACLRSLGLPARYVSGYLRTIPPEGKPRLVGADASHAWVSVYGGQAGWLQFDPTNNVVPAMDHVTIGWGRDYSDVCPIQGVYTGGGSSTLSVQVDVMPESEFESDSKSDAFQTNPSTKQTI